MSTEFSYTDTLTHRHQKSKEADAYYQVLDIDKHWQALNACSTDGYHIVLNFRNEFFDFVPDTPKEAVHLGENPHQICLLIARECLHKSDTLEIITKVSSESSNPQYIVNIKTADNKVFQFIDEQLVVATCVTFAVYLRYEYERRTRLAFEQSVK